MQPQKENEFDFFGQKTQTVVEEKVVYRSSGKTRKTAIAAFTAIAGLVGMHYGVDGAGWVIFLGFCML